MIGHFCVRRVSVCVAPFVLLWMDRVYRRCKWFSTRLGCFGMLLHCPDIPFRHLSYFMSLNTYLPPLPSVRMLIILCIPLFVLVLPAFLSFLHSSLCIRLHSSSATRFVPVCVLLWTLCPFPLVSAHARPQRVRIQPGILRVRSFAVRLNGCIAMLCHYLFAYR